MTKETKIIAGVLAGAALGAAIALVLSSDSGDEVKDKVSGFFSKILDSSKERLADVADRVKDKIADIKA